MNAKEATIGIVPAGKVPAIITKVIAAHISGYLRLNAEITSPLELPDYAFARERRQYDAGVILKAFESMRFDRFQKVVGVLDVDIFVPIFTYVFGEARQNGKYALVSSYRLKKNPEEEGKPPSNFYERVAKVALHELGHLFNIFHCEDKNCLMHFSGDLNDLDQSSLVFCDFCTTCFKDYFSTL